MIGLLVFLMVGALGISLRRAFVRIDELHRAAEQLRERISAMERAPSDLPPKGGSHERS